VLALSFTLSSAEVVVLTGDTFSSYVGAGKPAFVEFYAPWCGHCKKLAPEYDIVGEVFSRHSDSVSVAKVDCDAHGDLCKAHGVSGYPTLKWFDASGAAESYSDGRTSDEIIEFINEKTNLNARIAKPRTKAVELGADFDQVVFDKSKNVFVKFYAPWCGHCKSLAPDWEKLAKAFDNEPNVVIAKLDATKFPDASNKFGVGGYPTLIFFGADDKSPKTYDGSRSLTDLLAHVNENAGTFRHESGNLNEKAGRIEAFDAVASQFVNGDHDALLNSVQELAQEHKDKPTASLYAKLFEKVKAGGATYVDSEIKRLQKMASSTSVSQSKRDEFTIRTNILSAFNA
jgi:protein disulfide-isomerase-like protein